VKGKMKERRGKKKGRGRRSRSCCVEEIVVKPEPDQPRTTPH
jgi:hypothetical protein